MNRSFSRQLGVASAAAAAALALSGCFESGCSVLYVANQLEVTIVGDSSQVDRLFACEVGTKNCVKPRNSDDPVVSREPGPWYIVVSPDTWASDEVDLYAVATDNTVIKKETVKLIRGTSPNFGNCPGGSLVSATLTL